MSRLSNFFTAVVGPESSKALKKAVTEAQYELLAPMSLVAWVREVEGWNDSLPGVPALRILLNKSERGSTGYIAVGDHHVSFTDASSSLVATSLLAFLSPESVPLLKSQVEQDTGGKMQRVIGRLVVAQMRKSFERPGETAAAKAPLAPIAQQPPKQQATKQATPPKVKPLQPQAGPKLGKPSVQALKAEKDPAKKKIKVRISKTEIDATCPACGEVEFEDDRFVGCVCLRDYAHKVQLQKSGDDYQLITMEKPDFVRQLLGILKRR